MLVLWTLILNTPRNLVFRLLVLWLVVLWVTGLRLVEIWQLEVWLAECWLWEVWRVRRWLAVFGWVALVVVVVLGESWSYRDVSLAGMSQILWWR